MDIEVRPATKTEQIYCYTQSDQIMGQTGYIGHLLSLIHISEPTRPRRYQRTVTVRSTVRLTLWVRISRSVRIQRIILIFCG